MEAFEAGKAARAAAQANGEPDFEKSAHHYDAKGRAPGEWVMLGNQPSGATSAEIYGNGNTGVDVNVYKDKKNIGTLQTSKGEIQHIQTHSDFRRQGVANLMDRMGNFAMGRLGGKPIEHASVRTEAGDAWAKAVGGNIPTRVPSFGIQGSRLRDLD